MRRLLNVLVVLGIFAVAFLAQPQSAQAREYPWCAVYDWTTRNCGFVTYQQCLATIFGQGGWCVRNPRYVPPRPRR